MPRTNTYMNRYNPQDVSTPERFIPIVSYSSYRNRLLATSHPLFHLRAVHPGKVSSSSVLTPGPFVPVLTVASILEVSSLPIHLQAASLSPFRSVPKRFHLGLFCTRCFMPMFRHRSVLFPPFRVKDVSFPVASLPNLFSLSFCVTDISSTVVPLPGAFVCEQFRSQPSYRQVISFPLFRTRPFTSIVSF